MTKPEASKEDIAYENTDRELYREPADEVGMSYYQPSVHVTQDGRIGMSVDGTVIVMPIRDWHTLANPPKEKDTPKEAANELEETLHKLSRHTTYLTGLQGGTQVKGMSFKDGDVVLKIVLSEAVEALTPLIESEKVKAVADYKKRLVEKLEDIEVTRHLSDGESLVLSWAIKHVEETD